MATSIQPGPRVSIEEFERIFESVKNWGRWGPDDQLGTINYITPDRVRAAAALVTSGRRVSMEIPINTVAGPDNPNPAIHMVTQGHDIDIGSAGSGSGSTSSGWRATATATPTSTRCTTSRTTGQTYNGKPALEVLTTKGAHDARHRRYRGGGVVGRGVLLDIPRFRGVKWLEPGEAVTRAELEACEVTEGVRARRG